MKTLLITGAAQGIGKATARLFAERGWRVLGLDIDAGALQRSARECGFEAVVCDLAAPRAITDAIACIGSLDALVNNAAVSANGDPLTLSYNFV